MNQAGDSWLTAPLLSTPARPGFMERRLVLNEYSTFLGQGNRKQMDFRFVILDFGLEVPNQSKIIIHNSKIGRPPQIVFKAIKKKKRPHVFMMG